MTALSEAAGRTRAVIAAVLRAPFTRRARTELGYTLICLPLALIGFIFTGVSLAAGVYFAIVVAGLLLIGAAGYPARALGGLHRRMGRRWLGVRVAEPEPFRPRRGFRAWLRDALTDRATWRTWGFLALKLPVAVLDGLVAGIGWVVGLYWLTYPLWWTLFHDYTYQSSSTGRSEPVLGTPLLLERLAIHSGAGSVLMSVLGLVTLLAAPWATHAILGLDRRLIAGLLGPTTLSARVHDLEVTRARAVDESAVRMRQIERDLHDGAQARLVALAMKLGLAKEKLSVRPDAAEQPADVARAYQLVDTAHQTAKEAIQELRELVRGIHPPVLDQGLEAAFGSLAARSEIPVEVTVDLARRPASAIETVAYFCVAELLTNAAKHSQAKHVTIEAHEVPDVLRIRVTDDGIGGARLDAGTGLRGLTDRVSTVDGRLELDSPPGGPTVATLSLPLRP